RCRWCRLSEWLQRTHRVLGVELAKFVVVLLQDCDRLVPRELGGFGDRDAALQQARGEGRAQGMKIQSVATLVFNGDSRLLEIPARGLGARDGGKLWSVGFVLTSQVRT